MSRLLTTQQAAERLGLRPQTLANWRSSGEGPGLPWVEIGPRCIRYKPEDLERFISKRTRGVAR